MSCAWIDAIFVAAAKDAESSKPSDLSSSETALTVAGAVAPLQTQQQRNFSEEPSSEIMQLMAEIEWTKVEIALRAHAAQDSVSEEAPLASAQGRLNNLVRKLQQEDDATADLALESDDLLLRRMDQLHVQQNSSPAFMCA